MATRQYLLAKVLLMELVEKGRRMPRSTIGSASCITS